MEQETRENWCDFCEKYFNSPIWLKTNRCDGCQPDRPIGFPKTIETVNLKGYGKELKSRIDEMKRRVILPYEHPNGSYYVGRRGENGKIQEREPNY